MENVFGRKNYKLINQIEGGKILKMTRDSKFKNEFILTDNLVLLEMEKKAIIFDKPIYIGFSILELSKLHMYKIHYDLMKKKYEEKAILMYMDTDSLVYEIETEDVYDDLRGIGGSFDLSVYPSNFKIHDKINKGVLGTLKDEFASFELNNKMYLNCITHFTCLRSKSYSLKTLSDQVVKKCKGVVKAELNNIKYEEFSKCNNEGGVIRVKQLTFKTANHKIYTVECEKDGISRIGK
jgi:hypothetical protein